LEVMMRVSDGWAPDGCPWQFSCPFSYVNNDRALIQTPETQQRSIAPGYIPSGHVRWNMPRNFWARPIPSKGPACADQKETSRGGGQVSMTIAPDLPV